MEQLPEGSIAEIDLMFSHVDQNLAGKKFPKENFVFTGLFTSLLRDIVLDAAASPAESA